MNIEVPACDMTDPAHLEAFYGPGGFVDDWRKVVLASCREIIRAKAVATKQRISEARIDDLARLHDNYIEFLVTHLNGRRLREAAIREPMGVR